jgi:acyl carrier protein
MFVIDLSPSKTHPYLHALPMKQKIRTFIFEEIIFIPNPDEFSDDANLIDAGLDSMGIMRLIMFIEDTFGVTLPDAEIDPDNLHSLNALEQWILQHKK